MRIIGLDVGEKRIGVARVDSSTRIAVPIGYVNVDGTEWEEIAKLSRINGTLFFVLGLPRSNEGNETAQSLYVRNFAKTLVEKIPGAKIRFQDESLTSVVAEERLRSRRKIYAKGEIDAEAASIILQDFIESFSISSNNLGTDNPPVAERPPKTEPLSIKTTVLEAKDNTVNLTKKEAKKMKLRTKKAKHQAKKATKWVSGIAIVAIIACIGLGVAMIIRDQRYKEYAEIFKQQEAEMEADVFDFTIKPGETIFEVRDNLLAVGYSEQEADEALNGDYDFSFLEERPDGASLEGYLYGETHQFYGDTPAREVIETYLKGMEEVINQNDLESRYSEQGLTLHEGITLASVIQKEAGSLTSEMPTVAQIFLTRLNTGMLLGSDVTVSYALDTVDPDRQTYIDNQSALTIDSCYNTRVYAGLPCGPISNPGVEALLAVAEPTDTAYLYFLTGDDGLMYYSYTDSEHIQNVSAHCKELCNTSL